MDKLSLTEVLQIIDRHRSEKSFEKKYELSEKLLAYLKDPNSEALTYHVDIQKLFDIVVTSLETLSYKLIAISLEMVYPIVLKYSNSKSVNRLLDSTLNKLGDSKPQIREIAYINLKTILENYTDELHNSIDFVMIALKKVKISRNKFLKTHILQILSNYFENILSIDNSCQYSCYLTYFLEFLEDTNSEVRECAAKAITIFYSVVPELVKDFIITSDKLNPSKLRCLFPNIYEDLVPNTFSSTNHAPTSFEKAKSLKFVFSKKNSALFKSQNTAKNISTINKSNTIKKPLQSSSTNSSSTQISISEENLKDLWESDIFTHATSPKEVRIELTAINEAITDIEIDWEIRVIKMKNLRGLVSVFIDKIDKNEFLQLIKPLIQGMEASIKDLRSQVCKEACVTISYLSFKFGVYFSPIFDSLLPTFIPLFQNSTKIISSVAFSCSLLCVRYTHDPHIVIILINSVKKSKSKEIRKHCLQLIYKIIESWPQKIWFSYANHLVDIIVQSICDADSDTRDVGRRIFWTIAIDFKSLANTIFYRLDIQRQRTILQYRPESFEGTFEDISNSPNKKTNNMSNNKKSENLPVFMRSLSNLTSDTAKLAFNRANVPYKHSIQHNISPIVTLSQQFDHNDTGRSFYDNFISIDDLQISKQLPKPQVITNPIDKISSFKIDEKNSEIENISKNSEFQEQSDNKICDNTVLKKNLSSSKLCFLTRPTKIDSLPPINTPRSAMLLSMRKQKSNLSSVIITSSFDVCKREIFDDTHIKTFGRPGCTPFHTQFKNNTNHINSINDENDTLNDELDANVSTNKTDLQTQQITEIKFSNYNSKDYDSIVEKLNTKEYSLNQLAIFLSDLVVLEKVNERISSSQLYRLQNCICNLLAQELDTDCLICIMNFLMIFLTNKCDKVSGWISSLLPSLLSIYDDRKNDTINDHIVNVIEIIRDTFDSVEMLYVIFTFMSTSKLQSVETKLLIIQLINILFLITHDTTQQIMESNDFIASLSLMTSWAMDLRNSELRKNSKVSLVSMSQIDPVNFYKCLNKIPLNKQKFLSNVMRANLKSSVIVDENITDDTDTNLTNCQPSLQS